MYTSTFYCFLFFSSILLGHEFAGQLRPSATLSWDDHQVSFTQLPQESAIGLPLVPSALKRVEYGPELPPGYGVLASSLPVSETEVEGVCTADEAPKPSALSCLWAALNSLGAHWLDRVRLIILDPESALMQLYKVRPPVEALASSTPPSITLVLPPVEDLEEADGEEEVVLPTKREEEEDEAPETQQVQVGSAWYSVVETSAADGLPACASPNASLSTLTPHVTLVEPPASDNSDSKVDYVNDFLNSNVIRRVNEVPLIDLVQMFSLVAGLLFAAYLRIAGRVEEIKEKNVAEAEQRSQLQYRRVLKLMRIRKFSHFVRSHVRSLTYRNGKLRRSVKKTKGQLETSHSRCISLLSLLSSSHLRESSSNETILSLRNQLALVEAQLEKSHSSMVSLLSSSQQRETTANESILSLCSQYMKVEEKREEKSKEVEEKSKEVEEKSKEVEEKSKEVEEKSKEVEALTTAKQEVEERLKNSLALIAVLTSHIASLKEDNKEQRRKEEEREEKERQIRKEEKERQEAERLRREEIEREEKERAQREIEIVAVMKEDELARRVRQEEEDKRRREAKEAEEQRKKEMELREKALAAIRAREAEAKKAAEAKKVEEKRAEEVKRAEDKKAEEKRAEDKKVADAGIHTEKKYTPYSHFNTSKRSKKLAKMAKKLQQSPDTTVDHVPVPVPPAAPQQQKEKEKEIKKQEKKRDFRPSEVYRPPRTAAAHYPQE